MPTERNDATQTALNDALWHALEKQDFTSAELHLRNGAQLEHVNVRGETPLRFFAVDHQLEAAEWLVSHGANLDATDNKGDTALIRAVERKNLDLFNWIMDRGPDLNVRNGQGVSALMQACNQKVGEMLPFVQRLLDEGADPNAQSFTGGSPLLNAVARNDQAIVQRLLEANVDLSVTDPNGLGVLHVAMHNEDENASMALLLLEKVGAQLDVNLVAKSGATPASMAADSGKMMGLVGLMHFNVNLNVKSSVNNDRTPLMVMMIKSEGHPFVAQALALGADPNARDADGNNVLFYAAQTPNPRVLAALVAAGADTNATTGPSGYTPLHGVLRIDKDEERQAALAALLDLGFPVDPAFGSGGKTDGALTTAVTSPLGMAVMMRDVASVQALLDAGADPNRVDPDGETPMHRLAEVGPTILEQYAMQSIAQTKGVTQAQMDQQRDVLNTMIVEDCRAIMGALVAAGGDINAPGKDGRTPIMAYVAAGREDLVANAFVTHHADPLRADEYGDHAITEALKNGQPRLFQELVFELENAGRQDDLTSVVLDAIYSSPEAWETRRRFLATLRQCAQRDAWIHAQDDQGNTPLIVAAATGQADAVDALLAMKAEVNHANHAGETALMHGVLQGSREIIMALRQAGANVSTRTKDRRDAMSIAMTSGSLTAQRALREALTEYEDLNPLPSIELPTPGRLFRDALAPRAPSVDASTAIDEANALTEQAQAPAPSATTTSSRPRMR